MKHPPIYDSLWKVTWIAIATVVVLLLLLLINEDLFDTDTPYISGDAIFTSAAMEDVGSQSATDIHNIAKDLAEDLSITGLQTNSETISEPLID